MKKTEYSYQIDGSIIAITDLKGQNSVTVDAEIVLLELEKELGSLDGKLIIWRDGDEVWDGLMYRDHKVTMYALSAISYEEAKEKLLQMTQQNTTDRTFNTDSMEWGQLPVPQQTQSVH